MESAGCVLAARSSNALPAESVCAKSETKRDLVERETKIRETWRCVFWRVASCERKTEPTPPTPEDD